MACGPSHACPHTGSIMAVQQHRHKQLPRCCWHLLTVSAPGPKNAAQAYSWCWGVGLFVARHSHCALAMWCWAGAKLSSIALGSELFRSDAATHSLLAASRCWMSPQAPATPSCVGVGCFWPAVSLQCTESCAVLNRATPEQGWWQVRREGCVCDRTGRRRAVRRLVLRRLAGPWILYTVNSIN